MLADVPSFLKGFMLALRASNFLWCLAAKMHSFSKNYGGHCTLHTLLITWQVFFKSKQHFFYPNHTSAIKIANHFLASKAFV